MTTFTTKMTKLLFRSAAVGLLFVGVFGYAIQTVGNQASPILIFVGLACLLLGWERHGTD